MAFGQVTARLLGYLAITHRGVVMTLVASNTRTVPLGPCLKVTGMSVESTGDPVRVAGGVVVRRELLERLRFMQAELIPDPDPAARGRGGQPRRKAYRALGDLHGEYQRAMSEPAAVSRRASAWWPAIVALDEVADAATATGVAIRRGGAAPSPDAVHQLTAALYAVADAIDADVPPRAGELPDDEALKPVTDAVRHVLSVLGSGPQPARPGAAIT
jgi:hypothetical protein